MKRLPRVVTASPLAGYRVAVAFDDGKAGEVDLSDLVGKGVFAAWRDPAVFAQVFVDPETRTLAWPGGIDLCPDSLYRDVAATGQRAAAQRE